MPVVAPIHLDIMHRVGDGYIGRVHPIRQHAVISPGTQSIANTAAVEFDAQDIGVGSAIKALQDVIIIPGSHGDQVGIEVEAGAVARLGIRGIISHIHRAGVVEYGLQTIAPDQSRTRTHTQVAAIGNAGSPG